MMRIIGGKFGRRRLLGPPATGGKLRPTSDKLRETLFNILGSQVEGSVFVDAFAGTGAVGIEALSRGASEVWWIEKHRSAAGLIRRNLERLGALEESGGRVILDSVAQGLERIALQGTRADFLFLDPPYEDYDAAIIAMEAAGRAALLVPGGAVIVEHSRRRPMPLLIGVFERVRVVEQGDAALSFCRLRPGPAVGAE
jgi:16S rRNA (guanine(966)-N(2))-methyltransferase RsmD